MITDSLTQLQINGVSRQCPADMGVNIDGEVLGLSPEESTGEPDWAHT
jgi:hypothetical protein